MANSLQDELILPSNEEAERGINGTLMLCGLKWLDVCEEEGLDVRDFFHTGTRLIYKTLTEMYKDGMTDFDPVVCSTRMTEKKRLEKAGGAAAIGLQWDGLPRWTSDGMLRQYIGIVRECSRKRQIMRHMNSALESLGKPDVSLDRILMDTRSLVDSISQPAVKETTMTELIEDSEVRMSQRGKGQGVKRGIETGLGALDAVMGGCLPGEFIVSAARTGIGKTTQGLQWLNYLLPQYRCLEVSYEMPVQKLTDRMIQLRAKVNGQAFKTGNLSRDETERVIMASSELGHASLYLRDHRSVRNTFPAIAAATRRIRDNGGLDVLLVDYVQLMRGPEQNRVEQISTITRGLKLLAMELEIVVIGLCQLNRAVENRAKDDARISDLKESGSLEQDADKVFLWGREMDSGPDLVPAWVIVGKNRDGGGGKVKLEYNNRIGCFVDRE